MIRDGGPIDMTCVRPGKNKHRPPEKKKVETIRIGQFENICFWISRMHSQQPLDIACQLPLD